MDEGQSWGAGVGAGLRKNGRLRLLLDISKIEYFLGKIQLENLIFFASNKKLNDFVKDNHY